MIKDIDNNNIVKNKTISNLFISASLKEINEQCKSLKGNFFLDSFNYFPVTNKYKTFYSLFKRHDSNSLQHFYDKNFYNNLIEREKNFKVFENSFILGSSPADNYYTNLINFLPRIFFTNEKKINIIIHRNLSNKFRNLIKSICNMREIDLTFNYLDDDFYKFKNSVIPQFFNLKKNINILKFFMEKILENVEAPDFGDKIYIRRQDTNYRKVLNEFDIIRKLKENNFKIINPQHFEILTQIKIFSRAKLIISPHGSNLSNIIFCKEGAKVIEISPSFNNSYETTISNRYNQLSSIANLNYTKIIADTVDVSVHSNLMKKYINKKILYESDNYKNIILRVSEIDKLINNLQNDN